MPAIATTGYATSVASPVLTAGDIVRRSGANIWAVRALMDSPTCPVPVHRVGGYRIIATSDYDRFLAGLPSRE